MAEEAGLDKAGRRRLADLLSKTSAVDAVFAASVLQGLEIDEAEVLREIAGDAPSPDADPGETDGQGSASPGGDGYQSAEDYVRDGHAARFGVPDPPVLLYAGQRIPVPFFAVEVDVDGTPIVGHASFAVQLAPPVQIRRAFSSAP